MNTQEALAQLEAAAAEGKLSAGAVDNIRIWLTAPYLAEYAPAVAEHIAAGKWQELDDVFWTTIPFGTGGRRGRLYPIGTNAINDRTIGESAQGLADYVREAGPATSRWPAPSPTTRGIARGSSPNFAPRSWRPPASRSGSSTATAARRELSFAVRYKHCDCGIMITASHNPPTDNAVKVYWSTGGQLLPPHDEDVHRSGLARHGDRADPLARRDWPRARSSIARKKSMRPSSRRCCGRARPGPREPEDHLLAAARRGRSAVCPVLAAAGFADVEVFGPHAAPDRDFHQRAQATSPIPENAGGLRRHDRRAVEQIGADLILATDPDCDRLGCAARLTAQPTPPGGRSPATRSARC